MQTFLPLPSFAESAAALDRQRLNKQRSEVYQMLRALAGDTSGWASHPVTVAWRGHERSLCEYGFAMCAEWIGRGYRDTRAPLIAAMAPRFAATTAKPPPWAENPAVHLAYRRLLVGKKPEHYALLWPGVEAASGIDYGLLVH